MTKKKAFKNAFYGSTGGFFSQKKKIVLRNIKHLGNEKNISLNKFGLGNNIFFDMNSLSNNKKSANITGINNGSLLNLAANTPKAKHINTDAVFSSFFGSSNFNMNDNEVVLSLCLPIFLDKKWIDLKIVKTLVEVSVKKLFVLDINLLAVEGKSATAKTQLVRKLFLSVNGFGGAITLSKFEEII
ncbi:hypothetical protein G9A89_020972 [Geosiphon pyriformis]|nr:hypothetical protein G9A89_020972 [Geosiphon pyriformis]